MSWFWIGELEKLCSFFFSFLPNVNLTQNKHTSFHIIHLFSSLFYKTLNNFQQKHYHSTRLNQDATLNMSVHEVVHVLDEIAPKLLRLYE